MFPFELREQALCKLPHRLHHTNPWEGATCRTDFHCWMLSLFVAPPVRAITRIQTGVLTSVTQQPLLTFRTGTLCLCPSLSPRHRAGKLWLLPGNPWARGCFSLGSSGLMQTRFLPFSCCKCCFIPCCQEPTVPTAAKTEQGVNFGRRPDCLLIKNLSGLYSSWDSNQNWAILPSDLNG